MPASSSLSLTSRFFPPTVSALEWAARSPARISIFLVCIAAGGCATTDSATTRGSDPIAAISSSESCYQDAKRIFKRAMVEFGDGRWSEVSDAATRLAASARHWSEHAPVDASTAAEHRKLCATLASTSERLTAASNNKDSSAVATAFGEIAAQLSKLRDLNPPPPTGGVWT